MRSAFAPAAVALAALLAALARWVAQGSRNFYTAVEKQFYVPDPDVGWSISEHHPIWLGLEVIAAIAAIAIGLAVGGWIIGRREARTGARARVLRAVAWAAAVVPLAIPVAAFATGLRPAGGVDTRPAARTAAIDATIDAATGAVTDAATGAGADAAARPAPITGALALPAGRYEVVRHKNTAIAAQLTAGGDTFDARFEEVTGAWRADPGDLTKPMTAEVTAAAASVDTGIDSRSKHAREGYLYADKHPRIAWTLDRLLAARQDGPDRVVFRAAGTLALMGKTHAIEVSGALKRADDVALSRLGLTGAVLIAEADFSLVIAETALAADAKTFKGDRFPIHVSLVLRHAGER